MSRRILVMGLSGSGKTSLAAEIVKRCKSVNWLNADRLREFNNDWDFSPEGRIRQAYRIADLADETECKIVVMDFIAALQEQRDIVNPDVIIWMDTTISSKYADTDAAFEKPTLYHFRFKSFDEINIDKIMEIV